MPAYPNCSGPIAGSARAVPRIARPLRWIAIRTLALALIAAPAFAQTRAPADDGIGFAAAAAAGRVLILRHADAPGFGDPPGFRLRDCATQRNLGEDGRAQARALGDRLRAAGVRPAAVYSSQWCRCLETARLLGFGAPRELPELNSFFSRREREAAQIAELRAFLASQPVDDPPLILVTHQVVVTALTGSFVEAGRGAVFELNGTSTPRFLGLTQR